MRSIQLRFPPVSLRSVDSTNRYAWSLIHKKDPDEGTVILAEEQTKGKGQGTNSWYSSKRKNLLFSIVLKPDFLVAERQFYLSMAVAAGIHEHLATLGFNAMIKWPNDMLISGKKTAGILIENTILSKTLRHSVVGVGLNVNEEKFPPELPNPTSLRLESGKKFDRNKLLKELGATIEKWLNVLYAGDFGQIRQYYLNSLWKLHTNATFRDASGTFAGRIVDVAESGELMIKPLDGEVRNYGFKEVEVV
jgi:BirA family transcriptional regulator, biotin operon repressor / biotin---[acetyl-CoA-carboxylase] ligase